MFDSGNQFIAIFLDPAKDFDIVKHNRLFTSASLKEPPPKFHIGFKIVLDKLEKSVESHLKYYVAFGNIRLFRS